MKEHNLGSEFIRLGVLLNHTPWKDLSNLEFGYWPTVTVLYHEHGAPYLNILTDEARQTLTELGTGYHH